MCHWKWHKTTTVNFPPLDIQLAFQMHLQSSTATPPVSGHDRSDASEEAILSRS